MKPDQTRVCALLIDTVSLLCRSGLNFTTDIRIQGLLGITIDSHDVFLVHFNEKLADNLVPVAADSNNSSANATIQPQEKLEEHLTNTKQSFKKVSFQHHRNGILPGAQVRRRARNFNLLIQKTRNLSNTESELETDQDAVVNACDVSSRMDQSLESFTYNNIKTEVNTEDFAEDTSEEQDDVIFIEPKEETSEHGEILLPENESLTKVEDPLDVDEGHIGQICPYENVYAENAATSSSMMHNGGSSVSIKYSQLSGYEGSDEVVDIKPIKIDQNCAERWTVSQSEWHQTSSSQGVRLSCGPGLQKKLNSQDPGDYLSTRFSLAHGRHTHQTGKQLSRDLYPNGHSRRNVSTGTALAILENSHGTTPEDVMETSSAGAKMTYTVTKYICNLCNATFNHHCTLLTHQVRKHGRQKNARRGRPSIYAAHLMTVPISHQNC